MKNAQPVEGLIQRLETRDGRTRLYELYYKGWLDQTGSCSSPPAVGNPAQCLKKQNLSCGRCGVSHEKPKGEGYLPPFSLSQKHPQPGTKRSGILCLRKHRETK